MSLTRVYESAVQASASAKDLAISSAKSAFAFLAGHKVAVIGTGAACALTALYARYFPEHRAAQAINKVPGALKAAPGYACEKSKAAYAWAIEKVPFLKGKPKEVHVFLEKGKGVPDSSLLFARISDALVLKGIKLVADAEKTDSQFAIRFTNGAKHVDNVVSINVSTALTYSVPVFSSFYYDESKFDGIIKTAVEDILAATKVKKA